jgi:hypothetical protein
MPVLISHPSGYSVLAGSPWQKPTATQLNTAGVGASAQFLSGEEISTYNTAYHPKESAIYAYQGQNSLTGRAPINTLIKITLGGEMTLVPLSSKLPMWTTNFAYSAITFDEMGVFYYLGASCQIVMQTLMSDTSTATVLAGSGTCCSSRPCVDGSAAAATFGLPQGGMTADAVHGFVYFMDRVIGNGVDNSHYLRRIAIATGQVTTIPVLSKTSFPYVFEPWLAHVNGNVIFATKFRADNSGPSQQACVFAINYANMSVGTTSLVLIAGDPTNMTASVAYDGAGQQARFARLETGVVDGMGSLYIGQFPTRKIDLNAVNFECSGCPAAGVVSTVSDSGPSIFFPATYYVASVVRPFSARLLMFAAVSPFNIYNPVRCFRSICRFFIRTL